MPQKHLQNKQILRLKRRSAGNILNNGDCVLTVFELRLPNLKAGIFVTKKIKEQKELKMNPTKNTADKLFLRRRIIGLELCLLRTQKKMSLSEAASKSGVSKKNIKLIESGKSFSLYQVAILSALYGHELCFELIKTS